MTVYKTLTIYTSFSQNNSKPMKYHSSLKKKTVAMLWHFKI